MTRTSREAWWPAWIAWWRAAVWFGLAAASLHFGQLAWIHFVRDELTWTGREFLWMAPLSYLLVYGLTALCLGAAAHFVPLFRRPPVIVGTLCALTALGGLILVLPRIHPAASVALALGIAVQVARHAAPGAPVRVPTVVRALAIPAACVAFAASGEQISREWRERSVVRRLPPAPPAAPNVLVIVLDAVRAANLSVYGYPRETTPVLEQIAREGILFERDFATAPWTLPSHASLFTGLLPDALGADWRTPFSRPVATVAESLRDRGWSTAMFSANDGYVRTGTGLERGFDHVDDFAISFRELIRCNVFAQTNLGKEIIGARSWPALWQAVVHSRLRLGPYYEHVRRPANVIADRFLAWQQRNGGRPFFAFINFFDAHAPYYAPRDLRQRFAIQGPQRDMGDYDAAIAEIDGQIGRIRDSLAQRGALDHTVLVVTSDHGELFHEHGLSTHGNGLFLHLLQVPLLVRLPGRIQAGTRINRVTSLLDLAPTVRDLTGDTAAAVRRRSFVRLWEGEAATMDEAAAVAQLPSFDDSPRGAPVGAEAIVTDRWHYIEGPYDRRKLYAYTADPGELHDFSKEPTYSDTVLALRQRLRQVTSSPLVALRASPRN